MRGLPPVFMRPLNIRTLDAAGPGRRQFRRSQLGQPVCVCGRWSGQCGRSGWRAYLLSINSYRDSNYCGNCSIVV